MTAKEESRILLRSTIREFFQEMVVAAVRNQRVRTHEMAVSYLAEILSGFARAEVLYDRTRGLAERPVAFQLGDALQAAPDGRIAIFRKLGDFCLYISGFFSDSLSRKIVDVDYYIGMGEGAYSNVSGLLRIRPGADEFADLFAELAAKFVRFVDVFAEVSEQGSFTTNRGTLRLYEKWLRTSSERIARELRERGVLPTDAVRSKLLQ
jgi:hypothetical protein